MKKLIILILSLQALAGFGQAWKQYYYVPTKNVQFGVALGTGQAILNYADSTWYLLEQTRGSTDSLQTAIRLNKYRLTSNPAASQTIEWLDTNTYSGTKYDVDTLSRSVYDTLSDHFTLISARQKYSDTASWDATLADLPYVNVKEYGVTGNGTTDDTDSINACLAAQKGRIHYFPKGTYKISSTINLPAGTTILGEGYHSIITPAAGMAPGTEYVAMIEVDGSAPDSCATLQNIRIMGSRSNIYLYGWHGESNSFKNRVLECWFENFGCGAGGAVDPSNSHDNLIDGNQFLNCENAIYLTGTSGQYGNVITNNRIFLAKTAGIRGEYPFNTVIANNYIESLYSGIYIIGSYQSKGNVTISGNTIKITGSTQYYQAGIHCGYASVTDDPKYFTITGN